MNNFKTSTIEVGTSKPTRTDKSKSLAIGALTLAVMASTPPSLAFAQEDEKPKELDEIIVTARRHGENLQKVPVSVTVLNAEALKERRILSEMDLNAAVPALTVTSSAGSRNSTRFTIRGQGSGGGGVGVVSYFAEVPEFGTTQFFDLENVQVLKGPQGTLFGRNTTGGAVLFVPKGPTTETEGYLTTRLGNYSMFEAEGALGGTIIADKLAARAAFQVRKRDGFTHDSEIDAGIDDIDRVNFRLSALWTPTESFSNSSIFFHEKIDERGSSAQLVDAVPDNFTSSIITEVQAAVQENLNGGPQNVRLGGTKLEAETTGFINTSVLDVSDNLTFKNILGVKKSKRNQLANFDGTFLPLLQAVAAPVDINPTVTWYEELQVQGAAFDQKLRWNLGVNYEESNAKKPIGRRVSLFLPFPAFPGCDAFTIGPVNGCTRLSDNFTTAHSDSLAVFAHAEYPITDKLAVSGGIRYTENETETERYDVVGNGFVVRPNAIVNLKSDGISWDVTFDYNPSSNFMAYASLRHGYKAGGINTTAPQNRPDLAVFKPETVNDYEIGFKYDFSFLSIPTRLNVDVYVDKFSDIQRSQIAGPTSTVTANAAEATIKGAEVELDMELTDNIGFTFNYTRTDANYDSYLDNEVVNGVLVPIDRSGQIFEHAPLNKLTFIPRLDIPIGADSGDLSLSAQVSYQDGYSSGDRIGQTIPSYTLLNLRLQWSSVLDSNVDLAIFGTNVTDHQYPVAISALNGFGQGTTAITWGQPSLYGIELSYNF